MQAENLRRENELTGHVLALAIDCGVSVQESIFWGQTPKSVGPQENFIFVWEIVKFLKIEGYWL
jgi:hypothetical protein